MTDAETTHNRNPQKGLWKRRTGLEKILLVLLGVCGTAMVMGGSFYAIKLHNDSIENESPSNQMQEEDVCLTSECTIAAGNILNTMDQTADPCQNFFQFACGGWIANNEIPEAKSRWGKFYELRDKVDLAVRKIIESPKDEADANSVNYMKDHYLSCTNLSNIEAVGYVPFVGIVGPGGEQNLGGWPMVQTNWEFESEYSVVQHVGRARNVVNEAIIMSAFVYLDEIDTSHNVIYLDQPDLALPRSMYLDTENYAEYIAAYKKLIFKVAQVMTRELATNIPDETLNVDVEAVFEFEAQIAKISVAEEDRRNATEMYNPTTLRALKEAYGIDWDLYFSEVFQNTNVFVNDDEKIIVREPEYFDALLPILAATPKRTIANYVRWRVLMGIIEEGPAELFNIAFEFTGFFAGTSSPPPRWNKCVSGASSEYKGFGYAAGHKYILEYFDEQAKDTVGHMVENLISAFKELVGESVWMDVETQAKAQDKADSIVKLLGYPDWLPSPTELDNYYDGVVAPQLDTYLTNILSQRGWASKLELKTLREEPQRNIWLSQPAIVNAFYSPNHNSITFPAGILQPAFFGAGYPRYLNYGAIGVVIGHEITHGFDDQGRQYDGNGNAIPWWSPETIDAFTKQAQCFIDQYNNYTVPELIPIIGEENAHVNGQNTQGENIADNGGVRESFRAYKLSVDAQGPEPKLPGLLDYTPEQMFFISYAQVWCERITDQGLLNQILTDPHSPGKFRVFGPLSNSEDFVREYKCPIGPMNRENKCLLW